jgi:hypothetical protein
MQALNPALKDSVYDYQPVAPPSNYNSDLATCFGERTLDLLIPMWIADMKGRDISGILAGIEQKWFADIVAAVYEMAVDDMFNSPFHIFADYIRDKFGGASLDDLRAHNPSSVDAILKALGMIDAVVRQKRRYKMISTLLRSVGDLNVAITCDRYASLDVDEKVSFLGTRPIDEVVQLMARSRAIFNANPSYPSSLHERVVSGMLYESCVITDVNKYIKETFGPEQFVAYSPAANDTIADIFEAYDVESIAAAGAQRMHGDLAYSWDAHIDGLTRLACA